MLKLLFLSFLLFFGYSLFSQIIIEKEDVAESGNSFFIGIRNLTDIDPEVTGEDVVWDFSTLTRNSSRTDTFLSIYSTNVAYNVVFNPLVANLAFLTANLPGVIPGITIEDNYDFFKSTTSAYVKAGFGAVINSVPTPVKYDNPEKWYNFPLEFGQVNSSVSEWGIPVPGIGYYGQTVTRTNQVDGWGTVILPIGTFDVLRVKSTISITDTVYYQSSSIGFANDRGTKYEYRWLAKGGGVPVLTVVKETMVTKTAYFKDTLNSSLPTVDFENGISLSPNPAIDFLSVSLPGNELFALAIFDVTGKKVIEEKDVSGQCRISLLDVKNGHYRIVFRSKTKVFTEKLQILH